MESTAARSVDSSCTESSSLLLLLGVIVREVWQVVQARRRAAPRRLSNVVFMGMGEPLANFRNVVPALQIMLHDSCFDLSRRRVTLSTAGLVPQIYKLATVSNVALAVSLHAADDELRNQLVPINRLHPISELLEACWHYIDEQNGRSVTFEYVMLDGVNDSPAQARALAPALQLEAEFAVLDGLSAYEHRHGWKGSLLNVVANGDAGMQTGFDSIGHTIGFERGKTTEPLSVLGDLDDPKRTGTKDRKSVV